MTTRKQIERILALHGADPHIPSTTDAILAILKESVPPEKDYVGWVEPHTGTDKPDGNVMGWAKEIEGHGYNQCRQDMLDKLEDKS